MKAQTVIQTEKAGRYLAQLCKHFAHKVPAAFEGENGWVKLPMGRAGLHADEHRLTIEATAKTPESLEKLKSVMIDHLERFAFREDLQISWTQAAD